MSGGSYGFDMDGFVYFAQLGIRDSWDPDAKRGPKSEHAKPPTRPIGICVDAGRPGSAGRIGNIGPIYPWKP